MEAESEGGFTYHQIYEIECEDSRKATNSLFRIVSRSQTVAESGYARLLRKRSKFFRM